MQPWEDIPRSVQGLKDKDTFNLPGKSFLEDIVKVINGIDVAQHGVTTRLKFSSTNFPLIVIGSYHLHRHGEG